MANYKLQIQELRPFFAEIPYYLWGEVNYDSDGDCKSPTDRNWTSLYLTHRDTEEALAISQSEDSWVVDGHDPTAARAAYFLCVQCNAIPIGQDPKEQIGTWEHERAMARSMRVHSVFHRPELQPFADGHWFWGSWKWIGWFGTDFTWVGRWIMESLLTSDKRAVNLCAYWLQEGPAGEKQSVALRYALNRLTGLSFESDEAWVNWYFHGEGQSLYPEPDIQKWYEELKSKSISGEENSP